KGDKALYFASDRLFAISTVSGIEQLLHKRPDAGPQHPLAAAWENAAKHDVVIGIHFVRYWPQLLPNDVNPLAWMKTRTAVMTVDEGREEKRDLTVNWQVLAASVDQAKAAKDSKEAAARAIRPMLLDLRGEVIGTTAQIRYHATGDNARVIDAEW